MFMRKILAVLMLVCALGLFAQIPAGTKSVTVLTGGTGDILADGGFYYMLEVNGGYFLMDNLEIDVILGLMGATVDGVDMEFGVGLGAMYHMPLSAMLGLYAGAAFIYSTEDVLTDDGIEDNDMNIPIDVGLELFLTPNNAVRIGNRLTMSLVGADMTDQIVLGTVHYIP
jgi:hypothetical protein